MRIGNILDSYYVDLKSLSTDDYILEVVYMSNETKCSDYRTDKYFISKTKEIKGKIFLVYTLSHRFCKRISVDQSNCNIVLGHSNTLELLLREFYNVPEQVILCNQTIKSTEFSTSRKINRGWRHFNYTIPLFFEFLIDPYLLRNEDRKNKTSNYSFEVIGFKDFKEIRKNFVVVG